MAIKDDVKAIKEQIGAEEQFLESVIKGERIFKKYKYPIIGVFIALIVCVGAYSMFEYIKEKNLNESNAAYELLQKNPNDKSAITTLKDKNPKLYEAFLFHKASQTQNIKELKDVVSSSSDPILKSLATYELGDGDSEILKDVQILLQGYAFLKENKIKEAKEEFAKISLASPLQGIVKKLNHYKGGK